MARPDEPLRKRRLNPAHRRRALELLASSPHGTTEKLLVVAHECSACFNASDMVLHQRKRRLPKDEARKPSGSSQQNPTR